jgi:cobaltochelatase CobT
MTATEQELQQQAIAACTRALAEKSELEVAFGLTSSQIGPDKIKLADFLRGDWADYMRLLRGQADALAAKLRFHDRILFQNHQPENYQAREIFSAFEQVRAELLSRAEYAGVGVNIGHCYADAGNRELNTDHPPLPRLVTWLLWQDLALHQPIDPAWANRAHPQFTNALHAHRSQLLHHLGDQAAYAAEVRKFLRTLGLESPDAEPPEPDPAPNDESANGKNSAPETPPPGETDAANAQTPAAMADGLMAGEQTAEQEQKGDQGENAAPQPLPLSRFWEFDGGAHYRSFAPEFDEIISADQLATPAEASSLRASLDQYLLQLPPIITRLANKLQRKLLAQQWRGFDYDQDEGLIDPARLTRLVANPLARNFYRQQRPIAFTDTTVTLLLDNSGSMRGRPIVLAALAADILARTLERCGVRVEVLGFTTRSWKGGLSAEKWQRSGKPPQPGRLNDLRHIIYKSADQPWRRAKQNLGVMLKEGLLKENIDGEALLWAHQRLLARREDRRILMVISDGAPVDDMTTSCNGGIYLEQHLRSVIHWIEKKSSIELLAIGIGHDVTRYYENAVTISDVEHLAPVMLGQLDKLFAD